MAIDLIENNKVTLTQKKHEITTFVITFNKSKWFDRRCYYFKTYNSINIV